MRARLMPGEGAIPIAEVVRVLDAIGSTAPLGIEVFHESHARMDASEVATRPPRRPGGSRTSRGAEVGLRSDVFAVEGLTRRERHGARDANGSPLHGRLGTTDVRLRRFATLGRPQAALYFASRAPRRSLAGCRTGRRSIRDDVIVVKRAWTGSLEFETRMRSQENERSRRVSLRVGAVRSHPICHDVGPTADARILTKPCVPR